METRRQGRSAAEHKRLQVETRRQQRKLDGLRRRIADLERRIAEREEAIRKLEADMAAPGFFADQASADEAVKRHQALMWEVGTLMSQWEALEREAAEQTVRNPEMRRRHQLRAGMGLAGTATVNCAALTCV